MVLAIARITITSKHFLFYPVFAFTQVFVSKDVARHFGFDSAAAALKGFSSRLRKG